MRVRWMVLMASTLAVWPGCRCGSSTPPEPTASSTPRPGTAGLPCPARPAWAGPVPDGLLAELLMQPETEVKRNGTGIRVMADGRVFAYDEAIYDMKDGKLASHPIPGKWRPHKNAPAGRVDELKALLAAQDREGLTGFQGAKRRAKGNPSFLTVRPASGELVSCYRGLELGSQQKPVETLIKKIMGEAHSPDANKDVTPAASAAP